MRIGSAFDINIAPHLLNTAKSLGLEFEVFIEDLQTEIDREETEQLAALEVAKEKVDQVGADPSFFTAYQQFEDIQAFYKSLASNYSSLAKYIEIGTTVEGRPIFGLVVGGPSNASKPGVVFNGGQHAREWIAPATVTYILWSLVSQYDSDPTIKSLVDNFSWTIIPVVNGDGYVYTQTDRMWRKNRRKEGVCYGVDTNRNWDNHWDQGGSSNQPCDETYCGPSAFSEPEETALAHYIGNATNVQFYIDFHSYSQLWMTPWGWTNTLPPGYSVLIKGANLAVKALSALYGTQYQTGTIISTVYEATGSSVDWTFGNGNVKYSYAVELRDQGQTGFLLPPKQILPSGKETLAGVIALAQFIQTQLNQN
jgi:carboxypeptidase A1